MRYLTAALLLFLIIDVKSSVAGGSNSRFNISRDIVTFDCPLIDDSQVIIYPSACNTADGSITGIRAGGTITGNVTFTWYTNDDTVIANTADLVNVIPGTYTLSIKDESKCAAVKKKYTVGQRNNLTIDTTALKITPSRCSSNSGSVTGLSFENAASFKWLDNARTPLGNNPDLQNVPSGVYTLIVTSTTGCSTTFSYLVPSSVYFPTVSHVDTVTGSCNYNVGSVKLTINLSPADIYTYSCLDQQGGVLTDDAGQPLTGLLVYSADGAVVITMPCPVANALYSLVLTDPKYCSTVIGRYSLPQPVFEIDTTGLLIRDDACGRHTGQIDGLEIKGGTPPIRYFGTPPDQKWTWTDSLGNVVGQFPSLINVGKGVYHLIVIDVHGCRDSKVFRVNDSTAEALPPTISGATLCLPGSVTLSVVNPNSNYKYRIYDSTQTAISENDFGIFQQKVTRTTKFYVTTVDKLCESDPTPVTVTVVAPGVIIPNTFTPNNDGINDYWVLPHIDEFPGAEVNIFSREGLLVYHSINYGHPFDGKLNGQKLPPGVYYYMIDLKQPECLGKVSGSLTVIR